MSAAPVFARYIRTGDTVPHKYYGLGEVMQITYSPEPAPGRPHGLVTGFMTCRGCGKESPHWHGFTFPADELVPVYR